MDILSIVRLAGGPLLYQSLTSQSFIDVCQVVEVKCSRGFGIRWTLTIYHRLFPKLDYIDHTGQTVVCIYRFHTLSLQNVFWIMLQFAWGDKDICMCLMGCSLMGKIILEIIILLWGCGTLVGHVGCRHTLPQVCDPGQLAWGGYMAHMRQVGCIDMPIP